MVALPLDAVPAADVHAQIADIKGRPRSKDPVRRITDRREIASLARQCALTGCEECHRELRRLHECPCDRCKLYYRVAGWLSPSEMAGAGPHDHHPAGGTVGLTVVGGSSYGAVVSGSAPDRRMDAVADDLDLWLACERLGDLKPHGGMLYSAALFAKRTVRGEGWQEALKAHLWREHPHWWGEFLMVRLRTSDGLALPLAAVTLLRSAGGMCEAVMEMVVLGMVATLEGWG